MWLSDSTAGHADYDRSAEDVRYYRAARFDKGARAFAFCCAVLYAVLTGSLIITIVRATLQL